MPLAANGSAPGKRVFMDGREARALFWNGVAVDLAFPGEVEKVPLTTNNRYAYRESATKPSVPSDSDIAIPAGWTEWDSDEDEPALYTIRIYVAYRSAAAAADRYAT